MTMLRTILQEEQQTAAPSDADKSAANPISQRVKSQQDNPFCSSKVSITGSSILFDNSMRVGVDFRYEFSVF
jgi:hypothetical protein